MLSLALDLAIFRRLSGWPLDSQGRPAVDPVTKIPVNRSLVGPVSARGVLQPSYGVRIPSAKFDVRTFDLKTTSPESSKLFTDGFHQTSYTQVPIYWEGTNGRDWESIFPCVVFGETGMVDPDVHVVSDDFVIPDPAAGTLRLEDGTIVPAAFIVSPHPEQEIYTYVIKVFAKSRTELALSCNAVERLFSQRTALMTPRANGTTLPFDMIRFRVDDLSARPGDKDKVLVGDDRFYGRAYNYRVEAYKDFEAAGFGDQFSQQHRSALLGYIMELVKAQNPLIVQHFDSAVSTPVTP